MPDPVPIWMGPVMMGSHSEPREGTALNGGVSDIGEDAVQGHVGQVRVTGVGGRDAELAVFALAHDGGAVGVLLVDGAGHGARDSSTTSAPACSETVKVEETGQTWSAVLPSPLTS